MEGSATMGEEDGAVEGNLHMTRAQRWWGLRPWKRHSVILMVGGFMYTLLGIQYIVAGPNKAREIALKVLLDVAPIQFWGGVFIFAGLLAMVSSRWPPFSETWGYMVLTSLPAGWGATYLLGILFFDSPATNSTQVALWGMLAFMWWGISGLLNPDRTAVIPHERL
jgi:hypothetical protein